MVVFCDDIRGSLDLGILEVRAVALRTLCGGVDQTTASCHDSKSASIS